jgi:hypothetical protein
MILTMTVSTGRSRRRAGQGAKPSLAAAVLSRMLRLSLALLGLLAVPAQAHAVEGFVGVTERGSVVRFSTESPYALTTPKRPTGMAPGERIVALGRGERGVVAVGSSARLYDLDPQTAKATAIGAPFPQGLRGSRFSLAAAPNSDRARLLSDVGQDLVVDLQTAATTDGPGLRRARDGAPVRPAADLTPQGALFGVQLNPAVYLRELASGTTTMAESPLETPSEFGLGEPVAFQLGEDGKAYVVAVVTDRQRDRQSALLTIDPATGRFAPPRGRGFQGFGRRLTTFASLGAVPDDRTAPKVRVGNPRRLSVRALLDHRVVLTVRSSEAGQCTTSLRIAGKSIGFGFATRDTPGEMRVTNFAFTRKERRRLRADVGRRAQLVIGISDFKDNRRRVVRTVRLIR